MTVIKLKATKDGMEEALEDQGDLVMPPKGMHILRLEAVTPGFTQGDEDRPNIKMQWKIVGEGREGAEPQANYMHAFDYVSFGESSQWKRDEVAAALELPMPKGKKEADLAMEIDPAKPKTVIGKQVLGRIKVEKQEGYDPAPKIAKLLPLGDAEAVPDAFGDDDEVSDEAPEDDPFGGDDAEEENSEEGEETEEGGEYLTMEELEAMSGADLAATAKEFDVDVADFTGKGRTDAAKKKNRMKQVMEAIIEAQGAEEPEGDDEDPF